MGNIVESLAEVEADNLHCSPLVDVSCCVITEVYKIGEAWFLLSESMLKERRLLPYHSGMYMDKII